MKNLITTYDEQGRPENQPTPSEAKEYLLLLHYDEDDDGNQEPNTYKFVTGRTEAYETLKQELINNLDPFYSFIIVETVKISDRLSVATFMEHCKQYFPEDDFDLTDLGFSRAVIAEQIAMESGNANKAIYETPTIEDLKDKDVLSMNLLEKEEVDPDDGIEDV